MKTVVIMPGGFHPFHAGHASLYQSALKAFPNADVYVAATNDTKTRPFPFEIKEKLAKVAGVAPGRFVQVKSPFQAKEILQNYNPEEDVVVFVRSEKDRDEQPKPGGTKKDGSPAYFQPYTGKNLQPFGKHGYIAYLPTVEFGPGIKSATEIRTLWPQLNDRRKLAMVMSLYPKAKENQKLAQNIVKMLDIGMGTEEVSEAVNNRTSTNNEFYVYHLSENKVVDYVRETVIPEMRKHNVPPKPLENMYTVISSAIFENSKTSGEVEEFLEQFRKLDQRKNVPIKVGSKVSILNLQLSAPDFATLFGFKNPKTITKIYREPTSNKIIQLEFNNDPDDVWPRQPLAKFNDKFITDSILLQDANNVDKAVMLLNLYKPESINLRTSISEDDDYTLEAIHEFNEEKSGVEQAYNDPDTHAIMAYAQQHYPEEPDLQSAFVKFVLRSLTHSKEDDERQDNEIELLMKRVNSLNDKVKDLDKSTSQKVDESVDYLEEK